MLHSKDTPHSRTVTALEEKGKLKEKGTARNGRTLSPAVSHCRLPPAACRLPAAGRRRRGAAAQASAPGGRAGSGTRCGAGGGGLLASAATAARRALTSPPPEPVPPSGRRAAVGAAAVAEGAARRGARARLFCRGAGRLPRPQSAAAQRLKLGFPFSGPTAAEALLPSAASEPWPPLGCRPTRPRAPSLPRQPAARTGAWGKLGPLPGNGPVLPSPSNPHPRTSHAPLPLTQSKHRRMDRKRI